MNPVSTQQQIPPQFDFFTQLYCGRSMETTQVAVNDQQQKDITIYTDEGDTVTLTMESEDQLLYANYLGQSNQSQALDIQNVAVVQMQSATVRQETIEIDRQRTLTIMVEGDLSDQELADIKTALQKIDTLMTDILYHGDDSEVQATTDELRELGSLSGIEAAYQYEKTVAFQHAERQEETHTTAEKSPMRDHRHAGHHRMPGSRFIDDLVKAVKESGIKPRMFLRPLKTLFKDYSGHVAEKNHHGQRGPDWMRDLQKDVFRRIESDEHAAV